MYAYIFLILHKFTYIRYTLDTIFYIYIENLLQYLECEICFYLKLEIFQYFLSSNKRNSNMT